MRALDKVQLFTDLDADGIPTSPGLYAFYHRPIGTLQMGLGGITEVTTEHGNNLRYRVEKKIRSQSSFRLGAPLSGRLSEYKATHIARSYDVSAIGASDYSRIKASLARVPDADLLTVVRILGKLSVLVQPVYVGITIMATLRQRFYQHRRDYDEITDDKPSTFGARFRMTGFDWDELVFACIPTDKQGLSEESLVFIEQYFQSIAQPVLSVK
ncbi:MAG: hypothetical protein WD672_07480 [Woeseia sp.]